MKSPHRCKYCHRRIDVERAAYAKRTGKVPTFCRPDHNTLYKQRRRRLEARGIMGEELEQRLSQLPKENPKKRSKPRPKTETEIALERSIQLALQQPKRTIVDVIRQREAARTPAE